MADLDEKLAELRKLASEAQSESESWHVIDKYLDFAKVANPAVVLALLDVAEAAEEFPGPEVSDALKRLAEVLRG